MGLKEQLANALQSVKDACKIVEDIKKSIIKDSGFNEGDKVEIEFKLWFTDTTNTIKKCYIQKMICNDDGSIKYWFYDMKKDGSRSSKMVNGLFYGINEKAIYSIKKIS